MTAAYSTTCVSELLQLRRDAVELGVKSGADRIDGGDDHDRNAGGDQAIFDSGASNSFFRNARTLDICQTPVRLRRQDNAFQPFEKEFRQQPQNCD